jgi:hypothetical protein
LTKDHPGKGKALRYFTLAFLKDSKAAISVAGINDKIIKNIRVKMKDINSPTLKFLVATSSCLPNA